ncbi:MAG: NPCBM/NEW2 domain-containing protein [Pirellulales bacterium]|nr:NPCBM/NEW2 domain-containing protein [Pirellulales bacterium]
MFKRALFCAAYANAPLIAVMWWLLGCGAAIAHAQAPAAGPSAASPADLVPVDGPRTTGRLLACDVGWKLNFATDKGTVALNAADLAWWGAPVEPARGPLVMLADGGLLAATVESVGREKLTVESPTFGPLELKLAEVAAVALAPPGGAARRDRWLDELRGVTGDADELWLDNGDRLKGTLKAVRPEAIELETEIGPATIEIARVAGIVFNPALAARHRATALVALVGLADGSLLVVNELVLAPAAKGKSSLATLKTASGITGHAAASELVYLQPLGGRVDYLSDLEPQSYRHIPYLSVAWPYQADRTASGNWLRAANRWWPKGLGMHSAARLTYDLKPEHARFEAELAIDAAAGPRGSVVCRVYVDNKERFVSEVLRGGAAPVSVSVDVRGGKRVSLIVDFADRADELDYADWLAARLVR